MDANSLYGLMDAIFVACGIYVIYLYLNMKKSGTITQSPLLPKDLDVKKCKDIAGYIQFIGSRQLAFGIIALAGGAVGLVEDFTGKIGTVPYMIAVAVSFIAAVWYGMAIRKAVKMFW